MTQSGDGKILRVIHFFEDMPYGVILLRKKGLRKIRQDMARPPVFATFLFQDTGFPEIMQDSKQFLLIHTEDFPQTNRASFSTQGMQKDRRPCCIILHATFMGKSIFSVHGSSSVFPFFAIFWKTRPQYGLFQKKDSLLKWRHFKSIII